MMLCMQCACLIFVSTTSFHSASFFIGLSPKLKKEIDIINSDVHIIIMMILDLADFLTSPPLKMTLTYQISEEV